MFEHTTVTCACPGKQCTKCGKVQCWGNHNKCKLGKNGLNAKCKTCTRQESVMWARTNAEYNRARMRQYHAEHRQERNLQAALWHQKNRAYDQERHRRYRQEHIERIKRYEKRYRHTNRKRILQVERAYLRTHPEQQQKKRQSSLMYNRNHRNEISARKKEQRRADVEKVRQREHFIRTHDMSQYTASLLPYRPRGSYEPMTKEERQAKWRDYYYANKAYHKERTALWHKKNARRHAARQARRLAAKTQAGGEYTVQEWEALCLSYKYQCLRCGRQEPEITLTADHVVPIIMGGHSNISNIQPLCRSCNSSKGKKSIDYRIQNMEVPTDGVM